MAEYNVVSTDVARTSDRYLELKVCMGDVDGINSFISGRLSYEAYVRCQGTRISYSNSGFVDVYKLADGLLRIVEKHSGKYGLAYLILHAPPLSSNQRENLISLLGLPNVCVVETRRS